MSQQPFSDQPNPFRGTFGCRASSPPLFGTSSAPEPTRFGPFLEQMATDFDSRQLRRCYGFILFRFPCCARCPSNVAVCVSVCTLVLTLSASINFPFRLICCCSSTTCNRWNDSQLCSISQILEDNIPESLDHFSTTIGKILHSLSPASPPSILDDRLFRVSVLLLLLRAVAVSDSDCVVAVRLYYSSSSSP